MPDQKISQLTDGGNAQAADEFVVARSGSNFRIDGASVAAAATSVGTLTSLTVSGATQLAFASGTAQFGTGGAAFMRLTGTPAANDTGTLLFASGTQSASNRWLRMGWDGTNARFVFNDYESGSDRGRISNSGSFDWLGAMTVSGNLAVDTNTLYVDAANNRVGVGTTSPTQQLDVRGSIYAERNTNPTNGIMAKLVNVTTSSNNGSRIAFDVFNIGSASIGIPSDSASLAFYTNGETTERMRLDASGNLGLGVTPSAWGSTIDALQMGTATFAASATGNTPAGSVYVNSFFDGTNFKYVANGEATRYGSFSGQHVWYTAASGTAGNNISFTQAMTLDASGRLQVGGTTEPGKVSVYQSDTKTYSGSSAVDTDLWVVRVNSSLTANQTAALSLAVSDNSGTNAARAIISVVQPTSATSSGALTFQTNNAGTIAERARITSGGAFLMAKDNVIGINTSDGSDNGYLALVAAGADGASRGGGIYLNGNERSSDAGDVILQAGNVAGGSITFRTGASIDRGYFAATGEFLVNTTGANGQFSARSTTNDGSSFALGTQSNAGTDLFRVRGDGALYMGLAGASPYNLTTGSAANAFLDSGGYLYRSTSSLKYKTDIEDSTHGLTEVLALRPVTYKGINDGDKVFGGLIAEEVHEAGLSEFVVYDAEGQPDALHYGNMVSLLVKAVQEQQAMIVALEARLEALEA